jgi:carbon storage regulator
VLIIRRREGQSIVIGPDVEIQVIAVGPTQVKLGIVAPDAVTVLRKEVSATRQQNLDAAHSVASDRLAALFQRLQGGFEASREKTGRHPGGGLSGC